MGFPKGRNEALPFGPQRSAYSVEDIKLISKIIHFSFKYYASALDILKNPN